VGLRRDAKVSLLARVPLFERCSGRELARVAAIAQEVDYPAATPVLREGEHGAEFFVVVEGEVDIRRGAGTLDTIRAGGFFGEIALITGSPRTATVTTGTPVKALVIERDDFRALLEGSPPIQLKVLEAVSERLERLTTPAAPRPLRLRD
jgi:CRP-like cAMP-binding protein